MPTQLWLSGRCFECSVERIEPAGDGWIVKTLARRYFRFDAASIALLRTLMAMDSPQLDGPAHAHAAAFVERRLIPLGIYRPLGADAAPTEGRATSGTMRWQRELLPARQVRPLAAALAPLFSPWLLWPVMALCLWLHMNYALGSATQIGYGDLLSYSPNELVLLVVIAVTRGMLHELGHAAACWRLTRSVGAIGYGVFMATPVLYCDVSDIHLLPRKHKALVGLGGTVMDIVFLAALVAIGGAQSSVMKVYWLSLTAVLLNLLPFYRNDGYWVINDLAGTRDLLKQSLQAFASRSATLRDWAMVGFTAGCVAGLVVLAAMFAIEFGPQQVAQAGMLLPDFSGVVLAVVTALQYAALVFGVLSGTKTLLPRLRATASRRNPLDSW